MRFLVMGGDGYLGWPTAMHLSERGHEVAVVDNYLRRRLQKEEDVELLFEVPNLNERVKLWESVSGYKIKAFIGNSQNAVMTQIYVAMIAYLILSFLKFLSGIAVSLQNLHRVIQFNLFRTCTLRELFEPPSDRSFNVKNENQLQLLFS